MPFGGPTVAPPGEASRSCGSGVNRVNRVECWELAEFTAIFFIESNGIKDLWGVDMNLCSVTDRFFSVILSTPKIAQHSHIAELYCIVTLKKIKS